MTFYSSIISLSATYSKYHPFTSIKYLRWSTQDVWTFLSFEEFVFMTSISLVMLTFSAG